jgi:hypothetical protein
MSEESVEILRQAHARWAKGDFSSQEFLEAFKDHKTALEAAGLSE